jgi:4-carboxymuconolactone decarboxylase
VNVSTRKRLKEPRLKPLQETEWKEGQAKIMKAMGGGGKILNLSSTLVRNPEMMEPWLKFAAYVLVGSTLPRRDREILILRIGWLCRSEYEFGQHRLLGAMAGLTDEEIVRITEGPDAPGWSAFDAALLRAVDELHADAFISDATWGMLARQYSEKQLIDVVVTVGQYNLVSMMLNSFGVQRDPGIPGFPEGK